MKYSSYIINKFILYGLAMLALGAFFVLNFYVPFYADDYCRTKESFDLYQITSDATSDYFNWTGRWPVMFLNRVFFSFGAAGIWLLGLFNSLVLFYITRQLIFYAGVSQKFFAQIIFVSIFIFLWWFVPDVFGEVVLWKTGQIQYFWIFAIFLFCIRSTIEQAIFKIKNKDGYLFYLRILACFAGGMWLEHVSAAIVVCWFLLLFFEWLNNRNTVNRSSWILLSVWIVGAAILIFAPGNYVRGEVLGEHFSLTEKLTGITSAFIDKLDKKVLFIYLMFLVAPALLGLKIDRQKLKLSAFFFFISITIAIALLGAPNMMFFGRISAPSEMFIILSCMCLFPVNLFEMENLSRTNHFVRIGLGILATAFIILLSVDYKNTLSIYMNVSQQSQTRATIIKEAIANEVEVVELPPLYFHAQQSVQNYLKALKAHNQLKKLKAHKDHLLAEVQKAAKAGNQEDVDQIEEKIRNIVDPRIRKEQKKVAHWNKKALNTANGDVNTGRLFARDITGDPAKWQNTCFSSANHISRVKLKR